METVAKIAESVQINKPSQNQQISTPITPNRETHAALFALINKARLLNGWMMRSAQELDPTIRTWLELFAEYQIPVSAYDALYKRAFEARQRKMSAGQDVPTMDCTLLVSQWTGENGLQKQLREKAKIGADRQLYGESYTPKCDWCLDTNKLLTGPRKGETCPHRDWVQMFKGG